MVFFTISGVRPTSVVSLDGSGLDLLKAVVKSVAVFVTVGSVLQGAGGNHGTDCQNCTGEEGEGSEAQLHGLMMPEVPKNRYPCTYVKDRGDSRRSDRFIGISG